MEMTPPTKVTDKSEPETLAEFVRHAQNRLAPQAHGNEI
jgi:hypothetical protein